MPRSDKAKAADAAAKRRIRSNPTPEFVARERARNKIRFPKRLAEHRAVVDAIKIASGCVDCGERDPVCLDFDHRNPLEKSLRIGSNIHRSMPLVLAEIAKCDVRCANCHRRKTHRENGCGSRPNSKREYR